MEEWILNILILFNFHQQQTYNSYEACLTIDPILISDSRRIFSLTVRTQASNIEINYLSNSSTGASIRYLKKKTFIGIDAVFRNFSHLQQ